MKRTLFLALVTIVLAVPAAHATTMTLTSEGMINFDGFGNALTHTEDGVILTLTGWSASNGTGLFTASKVKRFSTGLGTCASSENTSSLCSSPQHAVDNNGRKEVLLLVFSEPVLLTEALISAWSSDFDTTFWAGTGTVTPMTAHSFATLDALAAGLTADKGHSEFVPNNASNGQFRTVDLSGSFGTPVSWLVFGAAPVDSDDNKKDHFKFKSLSFLVPEEDVPEPGVLALLAIGTAFLAARSRHSKKRD
jgi:PEP-CTERM motif